MSMRSELGSWVDGKGCVPGLVVFSSPLDYQHSEGRNMFCSLPFSELPRAHWAGKALHSFSQCFPSDFSCSLFPWRASFFFFEVLMAWLLFSNRTRLCWSEHLSQVSLLFSLSQGLLASVSSSSAGSQCSPCILSKVYILVS